MASDKMVVAPPQAMAKRLTRQEMECEAKELLKSGYFQQYTKDTKIEQAVANMVTVIMAGQELALPPLFSLQSMYVFRGVLCKYMKCKLALALRTGQITWNVEEEDDNHCVILLERWDNPHRQPWTFRSSYSIEDAKRAGLYKPDSNWAKMGRIMCRKQAFSLGVDLLCQDMIGPGYLPQELGIRIVQDPNDWANEEIVFDEQGQPVIEAEVTIDTAEPEYLQEDDTPTVTEADLEEFKHWGKELCNERGIKGKQLSEAVDGFLAPKGRHLNQLTPPELTVLMQDLQAFDFSTGGE